MNHLAEKYTIFKKPQFTRKQVKHHVDVFAITEPVTFDDAVVYKDGVWLEFRGKIPK